MNSENLGTNLGKKVKKSYISIIFSRAFIIFLLIVIQLVYFFGIFTEFQNYLYVFLGGSSLISAVMILYLINSKQNPMIKLTWSILALTAPIFTVFLYLFVKFDLGSRKVKKNLGNKREEMREILGKNPELINEIKNTNKRLFNLSTYVNKISGHTINRAYNMEYFPSGEAKFESMLSDLRKAKKFIFMEYFIVDKGYMWDSILNVLVEKVKEGVEVRVMYDGTCAISLLPYHYPEELQKLGIKARMFAPIRPFLSAHYNNRDHRKILVIDGEVAYTGGINIGDEYINRIEKYGHWKDVAIKFDGPAVNDMTLMFLQMYHIQDRNLRNYEKYMKDYEDKNSEENKKNSQGYIMPYGDYPIDNYLLAEGVYLDIINNAKDYVYIMTPYLVPDNEIIEALKLSAMKGVDVRIIMPHIPDKEIVFAIAHTYYKILIDSGVKIYEYEKGFVHAKSFLADDELAVVGTINLDFRSLYHNFECGALLYKTKIIRDIKEDFEKTFEESIIIDKEFLRKDKLIRKITGKLFKIIAPLI